MAQRTALFSERYTFADPSFYLIVVDDEVIIDVVKKQVEDCEAKGKSWVVQGFPRTKAQALAL